ncbi:MAG TPA: CDP-diacylglycerol diphosphatase [Caulobacteraceae bacterium]|jgi:CDP-diacylglycerol pyrophosphatase|nr:CDP-diacylglycerol diphosphatase [Caulobacteraceae bacterium]
MIHRRSVRPALLALLAGVLCAGLSACASPLGRDDPRALWRIVHGLCVRDERLLHIPAPCLAVNLKGGWAVVKDPKEKSHLLLVPTHRVTGVEDPALQKPDSPNYWQAAWEQRGRFERLVGKPVPRDGIGLAVNSLYGRTQDQLHIHLDCVKAPMAQAIGWQLKWIGPAWAPLKGHVLAGFYGRRLYGEDFGDRDPFKLIVRGLPEARLRMAGETLAAIGVTFPDGKPGFVLLAHAAQLDANDAAAAEGLLDHGCAIVGGQMR